MFYIICAIQSINRVIYGRELASCSKEFAHIHVYTHPMHMYSDTLKPNFPQLIQLFGIKLNWNRNFHTNECELVFISLLDESDKFPRKNSKTEKAKTIKKKNINICVYLQFELFICAQTLIKDLENTQTHDHSILIWLQIISLNQHFSQFI